ncbi:hypothetical protein CQA53_07170 [Helicobacter didelphidarum]|uniref:NlpC/P60 family protein n=2 Tax=Helicobacter didelphidarum TaxID=2040648 RepID=A0A3D8IIC9_9HELI|nr:hypothetical protein CQA53_07170 [Helicobacter didelphidarum]
MMTINFSNDSKATNTQQNNSLESFYGVSSDKMKMQQNFATKEEYLAKFYAVWDFSQINTDKNAIFYIIPSLQNAISYNKELQELKRNPPKKNNKNYKKAEQIYLNKIANLEKKIESLLGVGENLLPNKLEEFSTLLENMNLGAFLQNPQPAIIVRATAVRAVPTHKPRYKNKGDFPFDRWQNSFIFEGTPAMITHFSTDGRYAHIQSPFVYGWVDTRSIALVDNSMRNKILRIDDYKIPNKDFIPIRHENQWILDARIGQIFPYDKRKNKLLTFYKDTDNYAQIREVNFDLYLFSDFPIPFSAQKMSHLIDMMLGQKYGWGGIFGNRDCSAFTRDSFAGFGVFLPRNSAAQAQYGGNFVDLSKMSEHDKEAYIIANGIPFGSIIWLKGHIMLYIGHTNIGGINRAIVAHSAWGVNPVINNKKEKILLGGVKITTLHVGGSFTSNTEVKNSLLSRIRGITNIYTESNGQYDISQLQISY